MVHQREGKRRQLFITVAKVHIRFVACDELFWRNKISRLTDDRRGKRETKRWGGGWNEEKKSMEMGGENRMRRRRRRRRCNTNSIEAHIRQSRQGKQQNSKSKSLLHKKEEMWWTKEERTQNEESYCDTTSKNKEKIFKIRSSLEFFQLLRCCRWCCRKKELMDAPLIHLTRRTALKLLKLYLSVTSFCVSPSCCQKMERRRSMRTKSNEDASIWDTRVLNRIEEERERRKERKKNPTCPEFKQVSSSPLLMLHYFLSFPTPEYQ